jgi:hypothetical protein
MTKSVVEPALRDESMIGVKGLSLKKSRAIA